MWGPGLDKEEEYVELKKDDISGSTASTLILFITVHLESDKWCNM